MKNRMWMFLILSMITVSLLTGCGGLKYMKKTDTGKSVINLNVGYMPNYGSLWSLMTAIDKGYFEEQGIHVNLVEFQDGPTIITAMEGGSIDIGYIGQGAHKFCIDGKAKIFALSHISNGDALIGGVGITQIEELKGKRVAYTSGTSAEDILFRSLKKVGMTIDDVVALDMEPASVVTAMLSGSVDACATWSPNTIQIFEESNSVTKLADNMTFSNSSVSLSGWIVDSSFEKRREAELLRFTRALFKGMDDAAEDHFEQTASLIAKQISQDKEFVFAQRGDAKWLTGKKVAQWAADGSLEHYYELQKKQFLEIGVVEIDRAVEEYVMFDIMIEAGK